MEAMLRQEMEAEARAILDHLEAHGDTAVEALKGVLGKPDLQFYMALGDLILRHRVTTQERQGAFWVVRRSEIARAA